MNFIMDNWYFIIGIIAIVVVASFAIYRFVGLPTKEQITKVKEWLLYAVTMAEKEFGSETGKIKLRYVYDMFVTKFTWIAKMISFEMFSSLVDEALDEMRKMLDTNTAVKALVADSPISEVK